MDEETRFYMSQRAAVLPASQPASQSLLPQSPLETELAQYLHQHAEESASMNVDVLLW